MDNMYRVAQQMLLSAYVARGRANPRIRPRRLRRSTLTSPVLHSLSYTGDKRNGGANRNGCNAEMIKHLRHALASVCFAASVGCLGLWWRSYTNWDAIIVPSALMLDRHTTAVLAHGRVDVAMQSKEITVKHGLIRPDWRHDRTRDIAFIQGWNESRRYPESFGKRGNSVYFPLWYPALIFALAGVAALRLGRRFTLRSAIIATTVVAGLLGMSVVL